MSEAPVASARRDFWDRVPERLRPRSKELPGRGDLRRIETTVLVIVGLILAVAVVRDDVRQVHINYRLTADLLTWRTVTGHDYHNISIQQDIKYYTTRDVACGNTSPGPPGARYQVCLIMTGPILADGQRAALGGYYLPPYVPNEYVERYACFGTGVSEHQCGKRRVPAGAPDQALVGTGSKQ